MIFLRPWYLLLILLLPIFAYYINKNAKIFSAWNKVVDKELLSYLSGKSNKKQQVLMWWIILASLLSLIIGISGPSFEKKEIPTYKEQNAVMLLLDLSSDTSKSDLEKFKFEIQDIIKETSDLNIGLIVYTDEPFLISPITEDKNIIKNLLPQINHSIMPTNGNNIGKATAYAKQKLSDAGFNNGQIVFLSNNKKTNIANVINKLNINSKDLKQSQEKSIQWVDSGYYFLFLPLFVCMYLFRRGLFVILFLFSFSAQANIFLNANQQGLKAFEEGNYKAAQEKFKNKDWLASSFYKNGDYKNAISLFSDEYNQGNALAKSGKIEEAIKKYESVLQKNPDHKDAKFNLEYLKRQQQNQNQNQQGNGQDNQEKQVKNNNQAQDNNNQEKQSNNNKEENKEKQQNKDNKQNSNSSNDNQSQSKENKEENKKNNNNSNGNNNQTNTGGSESQGQGTPQASSAEQSQNQEEENKDGFTERSQAREQQYREIPEDIGGLLRAFIRKEYQQRSRGI